MTPAAFRDAVARLGVLPRCARVTGAMASSRLSDKVGFRRSRRRRNKRTPQATHANVRASFERSLASVADVRASVERPSAAVSPGVRASFEHRSANLGSSFEGSPAVPAAGVGDTTTTTTLPPRTDTHNTNHRNTQRKPRQRRRRHNKQRRVLDGGVGRGLTSCLAPGVQGRG